MPILEMVLDPGESVVAEGGDVAWLTPGFAMDTSTAHASGGGGGFMSGLKRMLGGAQLFLTKYTAPAQGGKISFAAQFPGSIRQLDVGGSDEYMIQSGSYTASTDHVVVSVGLQKKLGVGIFGGVGLVFQKLSGSGTAWVQLAGELVEYELSPGESLLIHPGHLAMFKSDMALEFTSVKGVKNKFFGDSLFLAELHGPGRLWLQSMTASKFATAIEPYLPDRTPNTGNSSSFGD